MSEVVGLERRYRRLLAWYPAEHRDTHGDEMIGVLLASAPEGQQRPQPAEALDLILGGLRIRLRSVMHWRPGQAARDALAVFSICMPAIWLTYITVTTSIFAALSNGRPIGILLPVIERQIIVTAFMIIPLWLGWRGWTRSGAVIAVVPTVLLALPAIGQEPLSGGAATFSLLFAWLAASLVASPGPRRGVALMTRKTWVVAAGAGLLIALWVRHYAYNGRIWSTTLGPWTITATMIILAVAAAFLFALPRPVAVRLLLLFATPACVGVIEIRGPQAGANAADIILAMYLPALALAAMTLVAGLVPRRWWRGARATRS